MIWPISEAKAEILLKFRLLLGQCSFKNICFWHFLTFSSIVEYTWFQCYYFFWQWQNSGFVLFAGIIYLLHWFHQRFPWVLIKTISQGPSIKDSQHSPLTLVGSFLHLSIGNFLRLFFYHPVSKYCRLFMPLIDFSV